MDKAALQAIIYLENQNTNSYCIILQGTNKVTYYNPRFYLSIFYFPPPAVTASFCKERTK
jgi:hypothetical protein